jgi:hypothetical protein
MTIHDGDYLCSICNGEAIVLWKDGELRDVHTVEPRDHAPKRPEPEPEPGDE